MKPMCSFKKHHSYFMPFFFYSKVIVLKLGPYPGKSLPPVLLDQVSREKQFPIMFLCISQEFKHKERHRVFNNLQNSHAQPDGWESPFADGTGFPKLESLLDAFPVPFLLSACANKGSREGWRACCLREEFKAAIRAKGVSCRGPELPVGKS
jgi:hypothetical protein